MRELLPLVRPISLLSVAHTLDELILYRHVKQLGIDSLRSPYSGVSQHLCHNLYRETLVKQHATRASPIVRC